MRPGKVYGIALPRDGESPFCRPAAWVASVPTKGVPQEENRTGRTAPRTRFLPLAVLYADVEQRLPSALNGFERFLECAR